MNKCAYTILRILFMIKQEMYDSCETQCVHQDAIDRANKKMPSFDELLELANFFKILGDHTRIRILSALYDEELCVCDLIEILKMKQSAISHQLRILRSSKIVKYRKEGKNVYYSLDDQHVYKLLNDGLDHIKEKF